MTNLFKTLVLSASLIFPASALYAFQVKVGALNVRSCTSGNPGRVKSPMFKLAKVPAGTKYIRFRLVDLDARSFNHGGGVVAYSGKTTIKAGAFNYLQPCPPNGTHRYVWEVTAQSKQSGGKIAKAKYSFKYP